jgi:predicted NAD/FAD-dependent oxidoreductase
MSSVIVIGAGLAGLVCARKLAAVGVEVRVFEKSRSLGGRCASRRFEGAVIDSGAQYFSIKHAFVREEIQNLVGPALCEITLPVFDEQMQVVPGAQRYYHADGNNRLGKALAEGLQIELEHPVTEIQRGDGGILVDGAACDAVVVTAPWSQAAGLFGFETPSIYDPCLTAAFSYDGPPSGPGQFVYGLMGSDALAWSACENAKPGRVPDAMTVMIAQASPDFSLANFDTSPEIWGPELREVLEMRWEIDPARFRSQFTHRWKFSRRSAPAVGLDQLPAGCFVAGDSICESRVESVWQSGAAVADSVIEWLGSTRG